MHKVIFIKPAVRAISGRKKLSAEDLVEMYGSPPPKELASLGSKKVIDPERVQFFLAKRAAAERVCAKAGVRVGDMYAIARHKAVEVMKDLAAIKKEVEEARDQLVQDLGDAVEGWIERNPDVYSEVIRSGAPTKEYIQKRISMDVFSFEAQGFSTEGAVNQFEVAMSSLDEQLLTEIAERAEGVLKESFAQGKTPSRRVLGALEEISEKVGSLAFLRSGFQELSDYIDKQVEYYRTGSGRMSEDQISSLISLFVTLADSDRSSELAAKLHKNAAQNLPLAQPQPMVAQPPAIQHEDIVTSLAEALS
ncbi:hypothetical protein HAQ00_09355 [Acidithiobacillus caldus ATCC 51756]|uniref:DUF3150 domain-containing protein n=1 Tax=Acidithiobacillus caldus TaxID=33059 RepID=UPI001C069E88|nr:DUF3150 domain-containing protein [Acidithiobacillus caldus]MBU2735926.1 hypothetical protein [Acidithiobacillus caldus ATCC 51756]MBU2803152.1 hypothetical protein [Acidithiobacillus caldus]